MKLEFDPDLRAVQAGEENHDTGKQDKPNLLFSKNGN